MRKQESKSAEVCTHRPVAEKRMRKGGCEDQIAHLSGATLVNLLGFSLAKYLTKGRLTHRVSFCRADFKIPDIELRKEFEAKGLLCCRPT